MQVDWFTWGAQLLNFLVLVAILKHFLYQRVLDAIDERDRQVQDRWDDAEQKKKEVQQAHQHLQDQQQQWEAEHDRRLQASREQTEEEKRAHIEEVRQEVEQTRRQWLEALERQQEQLIEDLHRTAAEEVLTTTRQMIHDLAEDSLDHALVRAVIRQLTSAQGDGEEATRLGQAEIDTETPIEVTSSFALSKEDRRRLEEAIRSQFGRRQSVNFEQADDNSFYGVVMQAGSLRWGWTVEDYLESLRQRFAESLEQAGKNAASESGPASQDNGTDSSSDVPDDDASDSDRQTQEETEHA